MLSLSYYEQSEVGLRGSELGATVSLGRFCVAGTVRYVALEDVISPELVEASPELAGLGVDMGLATLGAAWRVSASLWLGAAFGASWEDVLGVQRSDLQAAVGGVVQLPAHLRFGAALETSGNNDAPGSRGTAASLALSRSLRVAGVAASSSVGAQYAFGPGTLSQGVIGLQVRPPGPLSALGALAYERQPFALGTPYRRSLMLGFGVAVGSMRVQLARRWRAEGLGSELFVTLGLLRGAVPS